MAEEQNIQSALRNYYVKLFINDIQVPDSAIINLTLREWVFDISPRLELEFSDPGYFTQTKPIKTGDIISLTLKNSEDLDDMVNSKFTIITKSYSQPPFSHNTTTFVSITALMGSPKLYYGIKDKAYKGKDSFTAIAQVLKENNIEQKPYQKNKDLMTWIQAKQTDYSFLKSIMDRAWKEKYDRPFFFIDRLGKANLTTYKQLNVKTPSRSMVFDTKFSSIANQYTMSETELSKRQDNIKEQYGDKTPVFYTSFYVNDYSGLTKMEFNDVSSLYMNEEGEISEELFDKDIYKDFDASKDDLNVEKKKTTSILNNQSTRSLHNSYFNVDNNNNYMNANMFSKIVNVTIRPHEELFLADVVDFQPTSVLPDSNTNTSLAGKYIVGGLIHNIKKGGTYSCIASIFRPGEF